MTVWADGDSLQAELRRVLCRRANSEAEAAAAAGRAPRFRAVFAASRRVSLQTGPGVGFELAGAGPGAADDLIAARASPGDLAVTRDIPLAERLAAMGLRVLNDRGEVFTAGTAGERRSLRDRALELRALGLASESPRGRAWGPKELKAFADSLDRELARAAKAPPGIDDPARPGERA